MEERFIIVHSIERFHVVNWDIIMKEVKVRYSNILRYDYYP